MKSMTGSGTGEGTTPKARVSAKVSSVNHRFLDVQLRLPEALSGLEPAVREAVASRVTRGRLEIQVRVDSTDDAALTLQVDRSAVRALRRELIDLASEGLIDDARLEARDLLRVSHLLRFASDDGGADDSSLAVAQSAIGQALDQLSAAREREGSRVGEAIAERIVVFRSLVARVAERRETLRSELLGNLRRRLEVLLDGREVPEDRLAVEIAILADRADVSEEIDRLQAHLDHFVELMAADGAVGKRLDFLCQELLREVNTLGSKCRDAATTREVLEAKQLCEQIREQVQNVE